MRRVGGCGVLPWQQSMGVVLSSVECLWCGGGLQFKGSISNYQTFVHSEVEVL